MLQSDLNTVLGAKAVDDGNVALVVKIAWHPRPLFGRSTASDGRIALIIDVSNGGAAVTTLSPDGKRGSVLYGPVPLRPLDNKQVSPLGDPKWLANNAGVAFGVQQDDFSWKLMRALPD